jgi:hypothetical protein
VSRRSGSFLPARMVITDTGFRIESKFLFRHPFRGSEGGMESESRNWDRMSHRVR